MLREVKYDNRKVILVEEQSLLGTGGSIKNMLSMSSADNLFVIHVSSCLENIDCEDKRNITDHNYILIALIISLLPGGPGTFSILNPQDVRVRRTTPFDE